MKFLASTALIASVLLTGCATTPDAGPPAVPDLSRFHALEVESIRFTEQVAGALTPAERDALPIKFRSALNETLPAAPAGTTGAGVLRVQVTVTELNASSPTLNVLSTALLFVPFDSGGVAFEAWFYDSASGALVAHETHRHISTPIEIRGSFERFGHATEAFREWGEKLSESLIRTDSPATAAVAPTMQSL